MEALWMFVELLLFLFPIVMLHELGHFVAAKISGVKVNVVSFGFGRKLFGYKDSAGVLWQIALFPLGGYVKMQDGLSDPHSYENKSPLIRAFICIGGPLANFLLSCVILVFTSIYISNYYEEGIVLGVQHESVAEKVGIIKGDVILTVNGKSMSEISAFYGKDNQDLVILVKRGDNNVVLSTTVNHLTELGVNITVKRSLLSSIESGLNDTVIMCKQVFSGIPMLLKTAFNKDEKAEIVGPIGVANLVHSILQKGFPALLFFMAVLSINLGVFNLLPIPGLDGGNIVICLLDFITLLLFKKRIPQNVQKILFFLGFVFIIAILISVSVSDVKNLK
ncbi:Metalloprotease MmpA [Candidatus Fokinia solitaria]|uniref:Metalloprotease MmpA n=1 Tax=Candidatus Fokinia solitaria TaxID=1802984 RepID=A0A2U8BSN2_9RICK|nr:M50 family metallopeptidase [Candidatus Fokinia solitaria]AWD33308.1 Metalloprotease MmpA [Candidatus Fokinia solitaria]